MKNGADFVGFEDSDAYEQIQEEIIIVLILWCVIKILANYLLFYQWS